MENRIGLFGAATWTKCFPTLPGLTDRDSIAKHNIDLVEQGNDYSQEDLNKAQQVAIEIGILLTVAHTAGMLSTEIICRCTAVWAPLA